MAAATDHARCGVATKAGHPCTRRVSTTAGTCGWHDPHRVARLTDGPRVCRRCGQEQPADHYYASGTGNGRRRVCIRCLKAERAQKVSFHRHPRYNARGEVWCNRCQRYRHRDHFKPHPSRPGTLWSYCQECVQELDRARYHKTKFRPDKAAGALTRTKRKAVQRRREHRGRATFIAHAIDLLTRRGFTISEVARLTDLSLTNVYAWRKRAQTPTPAVEHRFAIALRATAHLPLGEVPAFRRRLPHPELDGIRTAIAPELAQHPVRSRWRPAASDAGGAR